MTDNLEQAGATAAEVKAEVVTEIPKVISHLEAFENWTEAEFKAAEVWIKSKL